MVAGAGGSGGRGQQPHRLQVARALPARGRAGPARSLLTTPCIPNRTPPERDRAIIALRRLRMTAAEIAEVLEMALSTVAAVLTGTRATSGYHARRYSRGWEYVHVCVDDATRPAYAEVLPDERVETAAGFLERAVAGTPGRR